MVKLDIQSAYHMVNKSEISRDLKRKFLLKLQRKEQTFRSECLSIVKLNLIIPNHSKLFQILPKKPYRNISNSGFPRPGIQAAHNSKGFPMMASSYTSGFGARSDGGGLRFGDKAQLIGDDKNLKSDM